MEDTRPDHPGPLLVAEGDLPEGPAPGLVTVGYLSGSDVANEFLISMMALQQADREQGWNRLTHRHWWINQRSGVNVSRPRNVLVSKFLAQRDPAPEWLLIVDSDMKFKPSALESLLAAASYPDRLIIGGLCIAFGADPDTPGATSLISTAFDQADPIPGIELPPFKVLRQRDVQRKTLREVYGTGAAFLLVHRQVLLDIGAMVGSKYPWYREIVVPDTREGIEWSSRNDYWVSEDLFFCLQAHMAGHRVFVHTGVEVEHVKPIRLTERLWRQYGKVVESA